MTNILRALRSGALISAAVWLASSAAALESGKVLFVGDHGSYVGSYNVGDKSMSVVINGLPYRGHFSDTKSSRNSGMKSGMKSDVGNTAVADASLSGSWGRAFLFASSAKVMKCKLDTGFPQVSGSCHDADGRFFQLMPASTL